MKLPYSEGTIFFGPLRSGGFARGVVARSTRKGRCLFGYFFAPRLSSAELAEHTDLDPSRAILFVRVGDPGLSNKQWPIAGKIPAWSRADWPIPGLVRKDPLGRTSPILVRYSDLDPNCVESEQKIDDDTGYHPNGLFGYGAVEIELGKLLDQR